jgi:tetratricopeptide (TPR) repeat protein
MPTPSSLTQTSSDLLRTGLQHHQAGRLNEAENCYREILEREPGHADALHLSGVIAQQRGQYSTAVQLIEAAIQLNPRAADYRNNLGNTHRLQGQLAQAAASYRAALSIDSQHIEALHSLAITLGDLNQLVEAQSCLETVLEIAPDHAEAHYNLGNLQWKQGNLHAAIASYHRAIQHDPDRADFHYNLGCALQAAGTPTQAEEAFRDAVHLSPDDAEAHHRLGVVLQEQGQFARATDSFRRALELQPNFAEALCNLAVGLQHDNDFESAAGLLRRAIALKPTLAEAHSNLGGNLWRQGDLTGAIESCRQAITLNPALPEAHSNLGHALSDCGEVDAAMASYHRALQLQPKSPKFQHYIAITHLLRGEFAEGWKLYENRWQTKALIRSRRDFTQPLWQGQPLAGERILLHAEQGLGDTLQFVRYVPLVAERGGTVILEVPAELRRLLSNISGATEVITRGDCLPDFSWHCPLLSLPLAFGTHAATIPANVPYLKSDPLAAQPWLQSGSSSALRVGLVWAGNPIHTRDPQRSISLSQFAPLAQIAGVSFFSLQKGTPAAQRCGSPFGSSLNDAAPFLFDFTDTAALISTLDLLISVDTAAAHLAGALGKPVWILLTHTPDWRWLLDRNDSPWYPTARLFRQPAPGDWSSVIARVAEELRQLVFRKSHAQLAISRNDRAG